MKLDLSHDGGNTGLSVLTWCWERCYAPTGRKWRANVRAAWETSWFVPCTECYWSYQIKRHVARIGERRSLYRICVAKLVGWKPLENLGVDENTEEDLNEIWYERVDRNHVIQYTDKWWSVVNKVTNLQVPYNAENFLNTSRWIFPRRTLFHAAS
jgi:hypothetical protein